MSELAEPGVLRRVRAALAALLGGRSAGHRGVSMTDVRLPEPSTPAPRSVVPLTAVLVVAVLLALGYPVFTAVRVTIDGVPRRLSAGTTVRDALGQRLFAAHPGDILSAKDGRMVRHRAGEPPTIKVDSLEAGPGRRLRSGDVVVSEDGSDTIEPTTTVRETIPAPVKWTGKGPLLRVRRRGSPGSRELVVGAVSGDVVKGRVLVRPKPMVIRRYEPPRRKRRPVVALTFDDGPWPGSTDKVLDVLKRERVKATFFLVGRRVKAQPATARRIRREGHLIGNHTQNHQLLGTLPWAVITEEVVTAQRQIRKTTGVEAHWFRPPGRSLSHKVYEVATQQKLRLVLWTVDPQDWRKPHYERLAWTTIGSTGSGAVILLHDGGGDRHQTVESLPIIIRKLREYGYEFVTLDGLR